MDSKKALELLKGLEETIGKQLPEIRQAIEDEKPKRWVPKKPTLCWVWDTRSSFKSVAIVVDGKGAGYFPQTGPIWPFALPMTRDEALELIDEPEPSTLYDWSTVPDWVRASIWL